MTIEIQRYEDDPDIVYKQTSPETLLTVLYPAPKGLIAPKVSIDRVVDAARAVSANLMKFKFDTLAGIGTSKIDTTVRVNYYGTLFSVSAEFSKAAALENYEHAREQQRAEARLKRRKELNLKLI